MPRYDKKCNICGYEAEVVHPMNHRFPTGCLNPDFRCSGVMENVYKTAPALTRAACPTRLDLARVK